MIITEKLQIFKESSQLIEEKTYLNSLLDSQFCAYSLKKS